MSAGPGNQPPVAVRYAVATFTRERGDRVTTRIDLVEGEIETGAPPPP